MEKKSWFPFFLASILILILTSIPKIPQPHTHIHFLDKIAHFLLYFLWGYTITIVWRTRKTRTKLFFILVLIIIITFPAFDELHQYLIPSRTPSILDWLADLAGATAGFATFAPRMS
ncbi:MAG: hypothetical protein B5M53_03945 [Candidatus Cloacimonas sp. 4484_209]|nr:MAG: hypothetical protein B5M53_03945 [Candidatus Cloacimonas sp. 4484_209]